MGRKAVSLAASIAGLILLSGCAGSNTIESVKDLRKAFEQAGGECRDWEQTDRNVQAAESGVCGDKPALMYYENNPDGLLSDIETYDRIGVTFIHGGSWMIVNSGENSEQIAEELDGTFYQGVR